MGDPRVERSRLAVREATLGLLCEGGYRGVSIDAVSKRSGVARTTIYRHWPSVASLVHDAATSVTAEAEPPDTGDTRRDLRALVGQLADKLESPFGRVLPTIIDGASRDPEMQDLQRAYSVDRRNAALVVARRGVERGDISPEVDIELIGELLVSPVFFRRYVSQEPLTDDVLDALVDNVWRLLRVD